MDRLRKKIQFCIKGRVMKLDLPLNENAASKHHSRHPSQPPIHMNTSPNPYIRKHLQIHPHESIFKQHPLSNPPPPNAISPSSSTIIKAIPLHRAENLYSP